MPQSRGAVCFLALVCCISAEDATPMEECSKFLNTTFKIAIEKHFPFYVPPEDVVRSTQGVDALLLHALAGALGFKYRLVRPLDGKWGNELNGTWNGMIGMLVRRVRMRNSAESERRSAKKEPRAQEVDAAAGGVSVLPERQRYVQFSSSYLLDRTTFVIRAPSTASRTGVVFRPFSKRVWVGLLLAMSISSLLLVLRNLLEAKLAPRIQPTENYLVTMAQIFRILMGQGIRMPRTWRRRLLPGVWILFGQTLSLGYSGTLISYMAHPGLEEAVDTVAKLAQAIRKGTFTCGTIRDAAEHSMLRNENSTIARLLLRSMESDPRNFVRGDLEGLERCSASNYAYIAGKITVDADIRDERRFIFAKDSFQIENYGIAFQLGFPCIEPVNHKILQLQGAGIISQWLKHTILLARERSHHEEKRFHPVNVGHLQGPLLLFCIGLSTSAIVGLFEVIVARLTVKKTTWPASNYRLYVPQEHECDNKMSQH